MQIVLNKEMTQILELVSVGKTNKEISVELNYSLRTVERRMNKLFRLYKVNNRLMLAQEYLLQKMV